ncbi:hypothetical protein WJX77_012228 [Trebouxia sp. C0004]
MWREVGRQAGRPIQCKAAQMGQIVGRGGCEPVRHRPISQDNALWLEWMLALIRAAASISSECSLSAHWEWRPAVEQTAVGSPTASQKRTSSTVSSKVYGQSCTQDASCCGSVRSYLDRLHSPHPLNSEDEQGSGMEHDPDLQLPYMLEQEDGIAGLLASQEHSGQALDAFTRVSRSRLRRALMRKAQELLSTKASMPEGQAQLVNEEAQEEETRSPLKKKSKAAAAKAVVRAANPAKVPAVLLQSLAAIQKILAVAKALEAATVKKGEGVQQAGCLVGEREGRQGMQQPSRCSRMQTKRQAVPLQACLQAQRQHSRVLTARQGRCWPQ